MDVFSLGRERDDKATSNRRLANQEYPVVVVVEEKDKKKRFSRFGLSSNPEEVFKFHLDLLSLSSFLRRFPAVGIIPSKKSKLEENFVR